MNCEKCKEPLSEEDQFCPECSTPRSLPTRTCLHCGAQIEKKHIICPECKKAASLKCPTCGAVQRKEGGKFCSFCGCAMVPKTAPRSTAVCSHCGDEIEENEEFCSGCGEPVVIAVLGCSTLSASSACLEETASPFSNTKPPEDRFASCDGDSAEGSAYAATTRVVLRSEGEPGESKLLVTKKQETASFKQIPGKDQQEKLTKDQENVYGQDSAAVQKDSSDDKDPNCFGRKEKKTTSNAAGHRKTEVEIKSETERLKLDFENECKIENLNVDLGTAAEIGNNWKEANKSTVDRDNEGDTENVERTTLEDNRADTESVNESDTAADDATNLKETERPDTKFDNEGNAAADDATIVQATEISKSVVDYNSDTENVNKISKKEGDTYANDPRSLKEAERLETESETAANNATSLKETKISETEFANEGNTANDDEKRLKETRSESDDCNESDPRNVNNYSDNDGDAGPDDATSLKETDISELDGDNESDIGNEGDIAVGDATSLKETDRSASESDNGSDTGNVTDNSDNESDTAVDDATILKETERPEIEVDNEGDITADDTTSLNETDRSDSQSNNGCDTGTVNNNSDNVGDSAANDATSLKETERPETQVDNEGDIAVDDATSLNETERSESEGENGGDTENVNNNSDNEGNSADDDATSLKETERSDSESNNGSDTENVNNNSDNEGAAAADDATSIMETERPETEVDNEGDIAVDDATRLNETERSESEGDNGSNTENVNNSSDTEGDSAADDATSLKETDRSESESANVSPTGNGNNNSDNEGNSAANEATSLNETERPKTEVDNEGEIFADDATSLKEIERAETKVDKEGEITADDATSLKETKRPETEADNKDDIAVDDATSLKDNERSNKEQKGDKETSPAAKDPASLKVQNPTRSVKISKGNEKQQKQEQKHGARSLQTNGNKSSGRTKQRRKSSHQSGQDYVTNQNKKPDIPKGAAAANFKCDAAHLKETKRLETEVDNEGDLAVDDATTLKENERSNKEQKGDKETSPAAKDPASLKVKNPTRSVKASKRNEMQQKKEHKHGAHSLQTKENKSSGQLEQRRKGSHRSGQDKNKKADIPKGAAAANSEYNTEVDQDVSTTPPLPQTGAYQEITAQGEDEESSDNQSRRQNRNTRQSPSRADRVNEKRGKIQQQNKRVDEKATVIFHVVVSKKFKVMKTNKRVFLGWNLDQDTPLHTDRLELVPTERKNQACGELYQGEIEYSRLSRMNTIKYKYCVEIDGKFTWEEVYHKKRKLPRISTLHCASTRHMACL